MIGEKKICQNEKMLVGIGHMCVPPHTYGMLLFDSLPEMLFLHTISSWGSARVSPPTFALLAHLRPAIKNPPKKRKKNQAAAAAALPKKNHPLNHTRTSSFHLRRKTTTTTRHFYTRRDEPLLSVRQSRKFVSPKKKKKKRHAAEGGIKYNFNFNLCIWSGRHLLPFSSSRLSSLFKKKKMEETRAPPGPSTFSRC